MTDEISDDVKRMAATIWMNRALAAEAEATQLRAAFLRFVQQDNACQAYDTGKPCHSHKCGCALEMQAFIDAVVAPGEPS